ncbi:hypothetical protein, partial [Marinobacter sp. BW6]|uniref:hypothetical protein n=1 Tax=Marinobacter sp. BW6 TaxID=2592624 RepID=UPI001F078B5C
LVGQSPDAELSARAKQISMGLGGAIFFFKQKTAYELHERLVGSPSCPVFCRWWADATAGSFQAAFAG